MEYNPSEPKHVEILAFITPSSADVLETKEWLLTRLRDGRGKKVQSLRAERLEPFPGSTAPVDLEAEVAGETPNLVRLRMDRAFERAIAELAAQGILQDVRVDIQVGVSTDRRGHGESIQFRFDDYCYEEGVRIAPQWQHRTELLLFDGNVFLEGLEVLLGSRGRLCAVEALECHQAAKYLATAVLLGSASEAAWYQLAGRLQLEEASSPRTAEVVSSVQRGLTDRGGRLWKSAKNDIASHEAYLRDLRNYAAHPEREPDEGREFSLTEPGSTSLVIKTRHYLNQLRSVAAEVSLLPRGD